MPKWPHADADRESVLAMDSPAYPADHRGQRDLGTTWMMHKYEIILYWSEVDRAFVAEVPELPGCMAHGDTQPAALENITRAMDLWIDTAREYGDPIPEPRGRRLMPA